MPPCTPPSADQLAQMVAPIALFPDKLVGQVLAGATYPQQISAANQWLGQNPSLKGAALQNAEVSQPWNVSVKSLTTFPTVLGQMASNFQWTTALGTAYVNDPMDVMNAIQLLRSRAQQSGSLKTSQHLRVSTVARSAQPEPAYVTRSTTYPPVYDGPAVIAPPQQTIVIEPAAPDIVYVPHYNPTVVYGAPVPVYPGWVEQRPAYSTETLVTAGALSFGIGVLVGMAASHHHDRGWNAWGVNWGGPGPYSGYGGGWHRPAVVYNNATYVLKSVTVVNHVNNSNNINVSNNNYRTVNNINNVVNHNEDNRSHNMLVNNSVPRVPAMMSMPHFTPRDAVPGARPLPAAAAQPAHLAAAPPMHAFAAQRPHANAMAGRMEQDRSGAPAHMAPAMPPEPSVHREADPGHDQAQRNHQDMQAMRVVQAHAAAQHADHHGEKYEQSAPGHQDHQGHQGHQDREPHEAHERHG